MRSQVVSIASDMMSGVPVFSGTRVPVKNLLDCLKSGETIDYFLEGFPSVSRKQVEVLLHEFENELGANRGGMNESAAG